MKKNRKSFDKFSSRSNVRERARRELMRLVEETNVGTDHARIRLTDDSGYRAKRSESIADGIFSETQYGYGFVNIYGEKRDIFIPEGYTMNAVGGDTVRIKYKKFLSSSGEEKTEGRITEILEYGKMTIIGTVTVDIVRMHKKRINRWFVIPDDSRIKRRIALRGIEGASHGDKVMVRLIRDGFSLYELAGDVVSVFGRADTKDASYLSILAESEIDTEFTKEELSAADEAAAEVISNNNRFEKRQLIFTIDSESAKDLDDAISLKINTDGTYTLGVHIADVSHYVKEKTVLDRLATRRGTSVYFTDKVVPMLPEALSNGACSLNPGEKKYALSATIDLSATGDILNTVIENSIITSHVKGIYSEINAIFEGRADCAIIEKYRECIPTLSDMHSLYKILAKKSELRGALELDSPEAEIALNENGDPVEIVRRTRGDAEKMIEQFMLTANEAVATLLLSEGIPCVYRVHEPPPEDKISDFITFAHNLGFDTSYISSEKCSSGDLARLMKEAELRGISEPISYACLRSMSKAVYSDIHRPHFGLGIENYCHFTSPIRRLSDLATYRIIKKVLIEGKAKEKYRSYAKRAAAAATDGEMRAANAERRIDSLYKAIYMSDHIGNIYDAAVSSITSFGIFVSLENTCEGLIPISTLDNAAFDEANISMRSAVGVIRIGDILTVRLEESDISRGKLRFSFIDKKVIRGGGKGDAST